MFNALVGFGLKTRFMVIFASMVLLVLGALQVSRLSFDLLPEFAPPEVEVQTEALGLAAAEVEALITVQLEEILDGVPWLQSMDSKSIDGLSSIVLHFEPGTDIMDARQLVQERLLRSSILPKVAKRPLMLQPVSSLNRVVNIGLSSQTLSLIDVSVLARWNIKPKLMGLPGVANVAIWGQRERQLQVQVDPEQLAAKGVRLIDVIKATGNALYSTPLTYLQASTPGTGGFIDTPNQRLDIRHVLPVSTPDQLSQVSFTAQDGTILRLNEVAKVVEGHQVLIGDGLVNGQPGLTLVVEKFPWANTLDVTRVVEETMKTLAPGLSGVEISTQTFRPASFIEASVGNIGLALMIGAVLAVAAVALGLLQWRAALVFVVVMGLSLATALLSLGALGQDLNALMLAGLVGALTLVIHDAVNDVHRIRARLRQNAQAPAPQSASSAILQAVSEAKGSMLSGTIICVLVILPVLTLGGLFGTFSQSAILGFLVMIGSSIVVALIATPALSLVIMSGGRDDAGERTRFSALRERYGAFLSGLLAAPGSAVALTVALVGVGVAGVAFLGYSLFPTFQERDFVMRWQTPPGISHAEMSRMMGEAGQAIQAIPGVREVGAQMGRAIESDRVEGINSSELWVSLDPAADYDGTVAAIKQAAQDFPGLRPEAMSFSTVMTDHALANQDGAIKLRTFGPDPEVLGNLAADIEKVASGIEGVVIQPRTAAVTNPVLEIEVNLDGAEKHGLSPGEIRRSATTLFAALEVGTLYEDQKVFEVVVWGGPQIRDEIADVGGLLIDTPNGRHVQLSEVANVRMVDNPTVLERHDSAHAVDLDISITGRDRQAALAEIQAALAGITYPLEYHSEFLFVPTELQANGGRLLAFGLAALGAIFLLLQAASGSWRIGAVAFVVLPAALTGGLIASLLTGGTILFGSLIGFVAVFGIVARETMVFLRQCRSEAPSGAATAEVVQRVASDRFEPILLTSLAIGVFVLPLVVLGGRPGLEILNPMAVTILGGLVTAALASLVLLPVCYRALRIGLGSPVGQEASYANS
jgi:Cu/Ag efflux pump CusA